MRKKHEPFKNIRTKDGRENFTYFLFEVDRGITNDVYIHKETQTIFNEDEYILNKIDFIQDQYTPQMVVVEISPLGKWEYNALKNSGVNLFIELCKN
jgi:hypothetical protein|tara:strand:+ start:4812 stop:5102 length:291 start_codon:yes stop_codon:yes gene_type:complete